MNQLIGKTFDGRFRIEKLIGRGGMGAVFLARHLAMGKPVALKVLARSLSDDPPQVTRFNQEAQNSSRLRHPNTIRVFDFGKSEDGYLYLTMEYLEGLELSKVIKRDAPLPVERAVHILKQIVKSIAEAHNIGLIHRDVKPDNIFLSRVYGESDFVKVLDFGIAKVVNDEELASLTQTGFICGTPSYLAPELAMGTSITPATDIYSIGVVAYEMVTGRTPFKGDSPIATVMKHIHDSVPPFVPDLEVPDRFKALITEMLDKDPARRPASADLLLERLEGALERDERALAEAAGSGMNAATTDQKAGVRRHEVPTVETVSSVGEMTPEERNALTGAIPTRGALQRDVADQVPRTRRALYGAMAAGVLSVALFAWGTGEGAETSSPPAKRAQPTAAERIQSPPSAPVTVVTPTPALPEPERVRPVQVSVTTTPPGASVHAGDEVLGNTPVGVRVTADPETPRRVTLRLPGYNEHVVTLDGSQRLVNITLTPSAEVREPTRPVTGRKPSGSKTRPGKRKGSRPKRKDRWRDFEAR